MLSFLTRYRPRACREALILSGRQSGKTGRLGLTICLWESIFVPRQVPEGETWAFLVVAPDMRRAKHFLRMLRDKVRAVPYLSEQVKWESEFELIFTNQRSVLVVPGDPNAVQGFTAFGALIEETTLFGGPENICNEADILAAVRPCLAVPPNSRLIRIGTPQVKAGQAYEDWTHRKDLPIFAWKLPSWRMNPAISAAVLAESEARDPELHRHKFGAEFTDARRSLIPADSLAACVAKGKIEFPPETANHYVLGADMAQASDACAVAIAHRAGELIIVDCVREWVKPPDAQFHDVLAILEEMITLAKRYGARRWYSDQVLSSLFAGAAARTGMHYERQVTEGIGSEELFQCFRERVLAGKVVLPDLPEVLQQIRGIEEFRWEGGYTAGVKRSKGRHGDAAIATCLAVFKAVQQPAYRPSEISFVPNLNKKPHPIDSQSNVQWTVETNSKGQTRRIPWNVFSS